MDAALIAAGKAVAKSAKRTPRGESSRQRPGKSSMGAILPTQRPFIQPTPVVMLTFCSRDHVATYIPNKMRMSRQCEVRSHPTTIRFTLERTKIEEKFREHLERSLDQDSTLAGHFGYMAKLRITHSIVGCEATKLKDITKL